MTARLDTATRQKQIVGVSLDIIRESGIQALTVKRISHRIGISEQAIYRHFASKSRILIAIIRHFNNEFKNLFENTELPESALARIETLTFAHIEYLAEHPSVAAVIFSEEIFQNEAALAEETAKSLDKRIDHITELMEFGQASGEITSDIKADSLAQILLGSLRLMVTRWRLSGFSFDLEKTGKDNVRNILKIIGK